MEQSKLTQDEVKNEISTPKAQTFKSALQKAQTIYLDSVAGTLQDNNIQFDNEQRACVFAAVSKMHEIAIANNLTINDFDKSNITKVLSQVALLRLNANAIPRECFLQIRKVYLNNVIVRKEFEFNVEGSGNDKLLRTYGQDVHSVDQAWKVRKGDEFTYPSFRGREIEPPTWKPKSYFGKIEKVVYAVITNSGRVEWLISDREEVATNLKAHIMNNCRYATDDVREIIMDKISGMTLDEMLDDKSLRTFTNIKGEKQTLISSAWFQPQSKEAMIERKMMNNATKKYPKNFNNSFISEAYEDTFEDYEQYREKKQITAAEIIGVIKDENEEPETTAPEKVEEPSQAAISESKSISPLKTTDGKTIEQYEAEKRAKAASILNIGSKSLVDDNGEVRVVEDDLPF
ncbi:MAG: hypothetical protein M0R51_08985 [Clostridia bacterium]|jgi:hypothetical protein|nr:hypothetical protein [Clostridia bacterium]